MTGMATDHANLGYAYCMTGKGQIGEQELREAIKLDNTSPQAQYLLGLLLLDQKSPEAGHLGTQQSSQAETSEHWVARVATLKQPSMLFGLPSRVLEDSE